MKAMPFPPLHDTDYWRSATPAQHPHSRTGLRAVICFRLREENMSTKKEGNPPSLVPASSNKPILTPLLTVSSMIQWAWRVDDARGGKFTNKMWRPQCVRRPFDLVLTHATISSRPIMWREEKRTPVGLSCTRVPRDKDQDGLFFFDVALHRKKAARKVIDAASRNTPKFVFFANNTAK